MNAISLRTVLLGSVLAGALGFALSAAPTHLSSAAALSSAATLTVEDGSDAEPMQSACGDGRCSPPEDCNTCASDCGSCCGDYRCAPPEDCRSCPGDCGSC